MSVLNLTFHFFIVLFFGEGLFIYFSLTLLVEFQNLDTKIVWFFLLSFSFSYKLFLFFYCLFLFPINYFCFVSMYISPTLSLSLSTILLHILSHPSLICFFFFPLQYPFSLCIHAPFLLSILFSLPFSLYFACCNPLSPIFLVIAFYFITCQYVYCIKMSLELF